MMKRHNNSKRAFYVIQFLELPFEDIDNYVCVPYSWLIAPKAINQKVVVSYPNNENPFVTRDRVKSEERYNDEWRFYMAIVKYESDSHEDAELWITTRNDYGPSIEKELKSTDAEPKFPLNKKLRMSNRNHSLKLKDNSRKPLPRVSIKRPALPESNKQLDGKLMKLDEAAQSSSAIVIDDNAKPGSSRQEQLIIAQDNQPMKSVQTESTASDSNSTSSSSQQKNKNLQESLPREEQQELSTSSIDVDTPILVIEGNEEIQPTSIKEQQVPSNQVTTQLAEQPEPIREPQIPVAPSLEMLSINQRICTDDVLNNEPASHGSLNSLKISAQLHRQMNEARQLIPTQKPVVRKILPMNIARNLAIAEQNPSNLMEETRSLSTYSLSTQQQHPSSSYQNQYLPTERNNFEQDLFKTSAESNNYEQRRNSRIINISTPSIGQNSITSSNRLYQTSEFLQQGQSQPAQQNSQQQPQKPTIRMGISIKQNNNRQRPILQGVTKKAPSPIVTKILNSIRQATSTSDNQYLLNEQQFQRNHRERAPVNKNNLSKIDNTLQTDESNLDSDSDTDHEVISDHEIPADEAPIERTNNFYTDRPIAAQNFTNHQTHSKVVLEEQMLDNFATLFTQMGSTLRHTCDMHNTLRSSILETAETYKRLLGTVQKFNSAKNLPSTSSYSSNQTKKVSQVLQERHIKISAEANSSDNNQCIKKNANNPLKKNNNSWRFVIPSEYDPHDSKWTLKYQTKLPGLQELMPESGIYVSYGDLTYCQQVSKDCKSLAQHLLLAVFNRKALSVCLSITEREQVSDNVGSNIRPELDDHACSVLLNFVLEYGLQRGWNTDLQPILSTLHNKIQEIRFKSGLIMEC